MVSPSLILSAAAAAADAEGGSGFFIGAGVAVALVLGIVLVLALRGGEKPPKKRRPRATGKSSSGAKKRRGASMVPPAAAPDGGSTGSELGADSLVNRCAMNTLPAILLGSSTKAVVECRFAATRDGEIFFDLMGASVDVFEIGSACLAHFEYGRTKYMFVSTVSPRTPEEKRAIIKVPEEVSEVVTRLAFGCAVADAEAEGVECTLTVDGKERELLLEEVGPLGLWASGNKARVPNRTRVRVDLRQGDTHLTLRGLVSRCVDSNIEVAFDPAERDHHGRPPKGLAELLVSLGWDAG